jgi:hypothetical protein
MLTPCIRSIDGLNLRVQQQGIEREQQPTCVIFVCPMC